MGPRAFPPWREELPAPGRFQHAPRPSTTSPAPRRDRVQVLVPEGDLRRPDARRLGPADHPLPARAPGLGAAHPGRAAAARPGLVAEPARVLLRQLRQASAAIRSVLLHRRSEWPR